MAKGIGSGWALRSARKQEGFHIIDEVWERQGPDGHTQLIQCSRPYAPPGVDIMHSEGDDLLTDEGVRRYAEHAKRPEIVPYLAQFSADTDDA